MQHARAAADASKHDYLFAGLASSTVMTRFLALPETLRRSVAPRLALISAGGWVTTQFALQQVLRLGTSVALAWLLAPELLGTMLLINTLRTGGELLSDMGIGQSIVKNPKGSEPRFYRTAWTMQIGRGLLLFAITLALTIPLANLYDHSELKLLLPVAATVFVISGFASPSRFLLQKRMDLRKVSLFGMGIAVSSSIIHVGLAILSPTIWALIGGLLISTMVGTVASLFLIDWRIHALTFDRESARAMLHFGKWIFVSSLIYFAAMNFDRLYLAGAVPLAVLGVYGVARTFADSFVLLTQRVCNMVIFPKVAGSEMNLKELRRAILPPRRAIVLLAGVVLAGAVAVADAFILFAYDDRYEAAAIFLPILLVGAWFSFLSALGDAIMMGIGKPSGVALANAAKLLLIVLAVPYVLPREGMVAAVALFALAEAARYAVLAWRKRANGLSFLRQDAYATLIFLASVMLFRQVTSALGVTPGFMRWVEVAGLSLG